MILGLPILLLAAAPCLGSSVKAPLPDAALPERIAAPAPTLAAPESFLAAPLSRLLPPMGEGIYLNPAAEAFSQEAGSARPELPPGRAALEQAVADGGRAAEASGPEASAASGAAFDASAPSGGGPSGPSGPGLPAYFSAADPADRAWFASVISVATRSKTAREVLSRVEANARRLGRPVVLEVSAARDESQYFNLDWDVVGMSAGLKRDVLERAATGLMHELTHYAQKAEGVMPSDALEGELEAYLIDMKVGAELGYEPEKGTWDALVRRRFAGDLRKFIVWLNAPGKGKPYAANVRIVAGGRLDDYREALAEQGAAAERDNARLEKELSGKRAVLSEMEATAQDPAAIANYRADVIAPLEKRIRDANVLLAWVARDKFFTEQPEGRRRYRAFARRVMSRLRRFHRAYNAL